MTKFVSSLRKEYFIIDVILHMHDKFVRFYDAIINTEYYIALSLSKSRDYVSGTTSYVSKTAN